MRDKVALGAREYKNGVALSVALLLGGRLPTTMISTMHQLLLFLATFHAL